MANFGGPYPYPSYVGYHPYNSRMDMSQYLPQAPQMPVQPPQVARSVSGQGGFVCRPVASRLEAETAQIPFDGSINLFYDTSADCLYSKTFNFSDGTAPLVTYVREVSIPVVQYATVEQLNAVLEEIERLKNPDERKVVKDDEPNE